MSGVAGQALANPPVTSLRPIARGEDIQKRLLPDIEELVAKANLDGDVGFAVADTRTGDLLEALHPSTGLPPASVAKTITSLYALHHLGPDFRFETRVLGTGPVKDGVLEGDLVLIGGGDPVLTTDDLGELALRLKEEAGLREVTGRFLVWAGLLPSMREIDSLQPEQVSYNPAVSAMTLNFNRVHFEWEKKGDDYVVTMDAPAPGYRPDVTVARMRVEDRSAPIYTYSDAGGYDDWSVARGALGKGGARWLPVRKPELYAGDVFRTLMRSNGIVLEEPEIVETRPEGTELGRHESEPLEPILQDMLKYSTNLTAELVGLTATRVATGKVPESLAASAAELNLWAARSLSVEGIALVDHSGLGEASRVPPEALARALVRTRDRGLEPLLKDVYLRDRRGRPLYDSPVKIHAKTGTLNFVSGLAGFVTSEDGREMAFAIFTANTERRDALTEAERERPPGGHSWNLRARMLQYRLLERWSILYGEPQRQASK